VTAGEQGGDGELHRVSRAHRRGSRKVEDHLLVRLVQAAAREVAGNAGKKRRPGASACSDELGRGNEREGEDVWETWWSSGVAFIVRRGRAGGVQRWGVRRCASFNVGRGGFGSVLARSADGFRVL
jgi:hypothetical protein